MQTKFLHFRATKSIKEKLAKVAKKSKRNFSDTVRLLLEIALEKVEKV